MKHAVPSLLAVLLPAAPALADGIGAPDESAAVPVPPAATAETFEGFFGGLEYGGANGGLEEDPGGSFDPVSASAFGLRAGYSFQNRNFVFGGAVRFQSLDGLEINLAGIGAVANADAVVDLRGRAGYAINNFLPYAALG